MVEGVKGVDSVIIVFVRVVIAGIALPLLMVQLLMLLCE